MLQKAFSMRRLLKSREMFLVIIFHTNVSLTAPKCCKLVVSQQARSNVRIKLTYTQTEVELF